MDEIEAGPSRPSPRQDESQGNARRRSWFGLGSPSQASRSTSTDPDAVGQESKGSHARLGSSVDNSEPSTSGEVHEADDDWQIGETETIRKRKKKRRPSARKLDGAESDQDDTHLLRMRDLSIPSTSRRTSETTIKHPGPTEAPPTSTTQTIKLPDLIDLAYIQPRPPIPPRSTSSAYPRPHTILDIDKTQPATPADRPLPPLPAHAGGNTPPGPMPREIIIIPSSPRTPLSAPETPRQPVHDALRPSSIPFRSPDPSVPGLASSIGLGRPGPFRQSNNDVPPTLPEKPVSVSTPVRLHAASPAPRIVFAEPDETSSQSERDTPTQEHRVRVRRARSLSSLWKSSPVDTPDPASSREVSRSNSPEPIENLADDKADVDEIIVKAGGVLGWLGVKKTVKRRQSEGRLPKAMIIGEKDVVPESDSLPPTDSHSSTLHHPSKEIQTNPLIQPDDQPPKFDPGSSINTVIAPSPGRLSTFFFRRSSARDEQPVKEAETPSAVATDYQPTQPRLIPNHQHRPRPRPSTAESSRSSLQIDEDSPSSRTMFEGDKWTNTPTEVEETLQSPETSSNWGPGVRPWMTGSDAYQSGSSSGNPALDSLPEKSVLEIPSQPSSMRPPTFLQTRTRAWSDAPTRANDGDNINDSASHIEDQPPPRSLQPSPFEGGRPKMPGRSSSGNAAIIGRMRSAFSRDSTKGKSPKAPAREVGDSSEFGAFQPQSWAGGVQMRPSSSSSSDVGSSRRSRSNSRARRGTLTQGGSGQNALLDLMERDRQVFLSETPEPSPRTSFTAASVSPINSGSARKSGTDLLNRKGRARASTLSAAPSSSIIARAASPPPVLPFAATPPRRRSSAIFRISHGLLHSGASSPRSSTLFPLPPRSSGSLSSGRTNRLGSADDIGSGSISSMTSPRRSGGSAPGSTSTAEIKALAIRLPDEAPEQYLDRISHAVGNGDIATILASSADDFMSQALQLFMRQLDFKHTSLDVALRILLMRMSLPKETQQIDRIIEAFATRYEECEPGLFLNKDNTYILAFSMIMLHTDSFNKHNKNKMTKPDYVKNTRLDGVPLLVLETFYDNITYTPFIYVDDDTMSRPRSALGLENFTPSSAGPSTPTGSMVMQTPRSSKFDVYQAISLDSLDSTRIDVEGLVPPESPFCYLGTRQSLDIDHLHSSFTRAFLLPVVPPKRKSSSASFIGGTPSKSMTKDTDMVLRVTKVGLLSRKDDSSDNNKKLSRKWKSWSVILTGSQLLFFRDPTWALSLLDQMQRAPEGKGNQPRLLSKTTNFKPDEVFPVSQCVAMFDKDLISSTNTFRYFMPPGRTYLFQAADDFEMNEWINLINYASTFKTADIPMRSAVVSKDRAFLAGAAAAASHKRERPIPGTTISKSPRKSVFGATEGKDPDVVSPSEVPLRPSFVRLDSATLKAAVDVSPADTLGQEPTENLAEIFDVVKADLAAERVASKPSTGSSSRHSADAQPERIETIEAQLHRFQDQAKHVEKDLLEHLRIARNIAILTPFQRSTREHLASSLPFPAHKIRQSRLHLAKVNCWIGVLQQDMDRERRDWTIVHHFALQAANKALHDPNGLKAVVQDTNDHDLLRKIGRAAEIPTLSLSSPAADDLPNEPPLTPNLDLGESDLLGRSPGELPIVIRRPSEDDSRREVSRQGSSGSLSRAGDLGSASLTASGLLSDPTGTRTASGQSRSCTPDQQSSSRGSEQSTPMLFALSDAE